MLCADLHFRADVEGTPRTKHGLLLSILSNRRPAQLLDGGRFALLCHDRHRLLGRVHGNIDAVMGYHRYLVDLSTLPLQGIHFSILRDPIGCHIESKGEWAIDPLDTTPKFRAVGFSTASVLRWRAMHPSDLPTLVHVNFTEMRNEINYIFSGDRDEPDRRQHTDADDEASDVNNPLVNPPDQVVPEAAPRAEPDQVLRLGRLPRLQPAPGNESARHHGELPEL